MVGCRSLCRSVLPLAALLMVFGSQLLSPAEAQEKLRVGKAVAESYAFIPLDVGQRHGIFKTHGTDIEITSFGGGARLQQAMAGDGLDLGVSAGPELALVEKGAPVKGVAMPFGPPVYLVILVRPDSDIASAAELKGHKINVSSIRSLTGWLLFELSSQQGWGPRGIDITEMAPRAAFAAIKTKQIDGMVTDITFALRAQEAHEGKILLGFGDRVKDFHTHTIFATNKLIAERPEAIRKFLAGWFDTIAFMRANKATTVKVAMDVLQLPETIAAPACDRVVPVFSTDGRFDARALATLSRSFVDLGLLPSEPRDMHRLYTEEFLPKP